MDVVAWLRSLDLSLYEGAFRECEIGADDLPELTDRHLKDLGVSPAHRLRMPRAIQELAAGNPFAAQPAFLTEPKPQDAPKRRQLPAMFSDMVDPTSLAADDPFVDPVMEAAMAFGEALAKAHLRQGGDLVDLLATFVGMVVQEDKALVRAILPRNARRLENHAFT
jgi:hypothetical protein